MTKDNDHRKVATHILTTANKVVTTERGNQHGGAEDSFQMIADLWMVYLNNTNRSVLTGSSIGIKITPKDVALMMDLLKTARHIHGDPLNDDNFVDKGGYTALAAALAGVQTPEAKAAATEAAMDRMTTSALAQKLAPRDVPVTKTLELGNKDQQTNG